MEKVMNREDQKRAPFMKRWKNSENSVSYHSMCRGISGGVAILN